jgi:hypothetical protein
MSHMEPVSESDIQRVSAAWLASQSAGDSPDGWVIDWQEERRGEGDYMAMWRFVLKLCKSVAGDDSETIGMIGADPLWFMIYTWPDETAGLIEAEVPKNPTLLRVLAGTWTQGFPIRERLDAILARHGQTRP